MAKKPQATSGGDRIDHSVFGLGTVLETDAQYTTIEFDRAGTKKFVTSMVKLKPSDTPAPERPARKTVRKKK